MINKKLVLATLLTFSLTVSAFSTIVHAERKFLTQIINLMKSQQILTKVAKKPQSL